MITSRFTTSPIIPKQYYLHAPPFSFLAWQRIHPIYARIKYHPYNRELAHGTLRGEHFLNYLSQDAFYLDVYHEVLNKLALKLENASDKFIVSQFAAGSLDEKSSARTLLPNRATLDYVNFLNHVSQYGSDAEISAAVLPCFWIYHELAREMRFLDKINNPYHNWIEQYSNDKFALKVDFMKQLTDKLAAQNQPFIREKMLGLFTTASQMEHNFWDSAYYARAV